MPTAKRIRPWLDRTFGSESPPRVSAVRRSQLVASATVRHLSEPSVTDLRDDEDAGFTLIELMVVLLILAILLAIAIPTFLGVTKSANDRAAQSNLNTALVNAKAYYQTAGQTYGSGTAAANTTAVVSALSSAEPALTFTNVASTSQSVISVAVSADGQSIVLAAPAKSTKNCWYIVDQSTTELGTGTGSVAPYTTLYGYTGQAMINGNNIIAGTWYGESKNTGTAPTCNASAPTTYAAAASQFFQGNGFPAL